MRGLKLVISAVDCGGKVSHSARSAWIETFSGLHCTPGFPSHSARSAWIETPTLRETMTAGVSHSARSAWIETRLTIFSGVRVTGRTPQGVRGLKHMWEGVNYDIAESHSARSAWIETPGRVKKVLSSAVALRKECVD